MRVKELSECRILIVDDAKSNVDFLVAALRGEYKLSVAMDGESALRNVEKSPPDLILLDIVMPGIDGYEVCRRLRENERTRELPVMFLSSLEDVHNKTRGFEMGGNDYLTKPFEILEIKARVRSLVKAKAYADAVRDEREVELNAAREIQMGFLPSDLSSVTAGSDLEIHAIMEPARQVGGDLFDVLRVGNRIVVIIGDVSGKGIPAAMFMAVTVTLARTMARQYEHPDEILRHLNAELMVQNPFCMFVTIVCLVFDLSTGQVHGANAGHNPLVFRGVDGVPRFVFRSTGKIAGVFPDFELKRESMLFTRGDTLILYTDGVTEAVGPETVMFEDARLMACLTQSAGQSATETAAGLLAAVRGHSAGVPQSDDITIVTVRQCGEFMQANG